MQTLTNGLASKPTKSFKAIQSEVQNTTSVALSVDCVIFGFDENKLKVLLIRSDFKKYESKWSLLGDLVKPDEDLDASAYRILKERTGLDDVYLEQVHTFGEINRHPAGRVVTEAYCSLINIQHHKLEILKNELHWHDVAGVNDWHLIIPKFLKPHYLNCGKEYRNIRSASALLPSKFSLRELQNLYEAILNIKLDRRNFRKKFFSMDFLIDLDEIEQNVPHRPGKLYRFDYEKYQSRQKKLGGIDF